MKILFPFSGVACVSFPVGKPPWGTCEFASKRCLAECAAFKNAKEAISTDDPGNIIGYEAKERAFRFMTERPFLTVCSRILYELERMNTRILYWFASGDCMTKYSQRISDIMKHLALEGIIQCGFTRNVDLWTTVKKFPGVRFALTVENKHSATELSEDGLVAIPDFDAKLAGVGLFMKKRNWGYCGSSTYGLDKVEYEANCQLCYNNQRGCFT